MSRPSLYIIAGCNGAGKTTASMTILPEILECGEFVNADEIAKGLSPFHPEEMAIEAGRLMLDRIEQLLTSRRTFAIETTLATKSYRRLVARAREAGYHVSLLFFWLPSVATAVDRVAHRVATGGHDIPAEVIERRYWAGLDNLFNIYSSIVDVWSLYDNNGALQPIVERNQIVDNIKLQNIKSLCQRKKKK